MGSTPVENSSFKRANFIYMLVALLAFLVLSPLAQILFPDNASIIINFTFTITIVIGVWSLIDDRKWFQFGLGLAAFSFLLSLLEFFYSSQFIYIASILVLLFFLINSLVLAIKHILFGPKIDMNKIVGSVTIYLLIGIIWALLYGLVEEVFTGSFEGTHLAEDGSRFWDLIYFSFVTLTTLGYGDILPVNTYARTLAYMEAIVGQFYIAILVASLVSAHLHERKFKKE
ncbi:MAG: two pore domain potassium channel family protein [Gammaproteobacteria bacterium]|nr:two pore domain potassium channel family protein [Gammaproteobacteria bacterium]